MSLFGESTSETESAEKEFVELEDMRKLGIATLGSLKQHPRISAFRSFIESWYLILQRNIVISHAVHTISID
jgi:hypothetical protein